MNTEQIILVDPFDDDQVKLIEDFEKNNNITTLTTSYIKNVRKISKKEYEIKNKSSNDLKAGLIVLHNGEVKDICFIEAEKDIKTCHISFTNNSKRKSIISYATDYAINSLKMEEIFVRVPSTEKQLKSILEKEGYENLGDDNGSIIFLKEKEDTLSYGRQI